MDPESPYRYTEYPYARILRDWDTCRGQVVRFIVQLEYGLDEEFYWPRNCDDWRTVARFDHNPQAPDGHDVREEGLHMDIYKKEDEYEKTTDFPYVHVDEAPRWCEEYFIENLDFLLERFEELHEVEDNKWAVTLRQ